MNINLNEVLETLNKLHKEVEEKIKNHSQKELVEKLGMSQGEISKIKSGKKNLSHEKAIEILKKLR